MNIDKKLELAHEYAVANNSYSSDAWSYADAMEVEYNKRKQAKAEKDAEDAKLFFDKLTKNEYACANHLHKTLNGGECFDCGEELGKQE